MNLTCVVSFWFCPDLNLQLRRDKFRKFSWKNKCSAALGVILFFLLHPGIGDTEIFQGFNCFF